MNDVADLARRLKERIGSYRSGEAAKAQVCEFFRHYAGPRSSFLKEADKIGGSDPYMISRLSAIVDSFAEYVTAGLTTGIAPERQAQLDVVSDVLVQAQALLDGTSYHPAASIVLTGASLEEFLRTWTEAAGLSIGSAKPSIDAYAKALRGADVITKQDVKDIASWGGLRNDAAHGNWDRVSDRTQARLMLEGVNLFMRQNRDAWGAV